MGCTVSIPQREGGIEGFPVGLYNLIFGIAVHAVNVRNLVRLDECVIEAGIVIGLLVIRTCYLNTAQVFVPISFCCFASSFEIPSRHFGVHILAGTFHTGGRQSNLGHQFITRLQIEAGHDALTLFGLSHRQVDLFGSRTVELQYEEIILMYPHAVSDMAGQGLCVFPFHLAEADL